MHENKIRVIDSVMGSGKSTYAINHINDNIDENFIIVVPTKSEQQRYKKALDRDVFLPNLDEGADRLLQSFNWAVMDNKTIITTHKLLECWDSTSIREIKKKDYTLILDEVIDVVNPVSIKKCDFELLLESGYIEIETVGTQDKLVTVKAVEGKEYDGAIHKFLEQVKNNNVYQVNGVYYAWVAPPEKLKAFDNVYILTYLFHGQQFKGWLDLHDIPYSLHSVIDNKLVDYQKPNGSQFRDLITINDDKKLNQAYSRSTSLSASHYEKAKGDKVKQLQNDIRSFFRSHSKTDPTQKRSINFFTWF